MFIIIYNINNIFLNNILNIMLLNDKINDIIDNHKNKLIDEIKSAILTCIDTTEYMFHEETLEIYYSDAIKQIKPRVFSYLNNEFKYCHSLFYYVPKVLTKNNYFIVRRDNPGRSNMYMLFDSVQDFLTFESLTVKSQKLFHEVILGNKPQKIRYDIDIDNKSGTIPLSYLNTMIFNVICATCTELISNYNRVSINLHDFLICRSISDTNSKYSCHIIYDNPASYLKNSNEAKQFYERVMSYLPKEYVDKHYIDANIYKSTSSLRLLNSHKGSQPYRIKQLDEKFLSDKVINLIIDNLSKAYNDNIEFITSVISNKLRFVKYEDTLCGYYGDNSDIECIDDPVNYTKYNYLVEKYQQPTTPDIVSDKIGKERMEYAIKMILDKYPMFTFRNIISSRNIISFNRQASSYCDLCKREHEKDNTMYGYVSDKEISVRCYRYNDEHKDDIKNNKKFTKSIVLEKLVTDNDKKKKVEWLPSKIIQQVEDKCVTVVRNNEFVKLDIDFSLPVDNIPDIEIIEDNRADVDDIGIGLSKTIAIKSAMGSGKTKWLRKLIGQSPDLYIVMVSFRISFSVDIATKFGNLGFVNYSNIKDKISIDAHKRIICQFESLHRLTDIINSNRKLLLLMDESESILDQLSSGFNREFHTANWLNFNRLLKFAEYTIAMDAFMTNRTLNCLIDSRGKDDFKFINNSYKLGYDDNYGQKVGEQKTEYIYKYTTEFLNQLAIAINDNKKIFIVWTSKIEKLQSILQLMASDKKVAFYNSETINDKRSELDNVHESWIKYDIVAISPTVMAGISFELKHFDVCFTYQSTQTTPYPLAMQMCARVRNLNDNIIHSYIGYRSSTGLAKNRDEIENIICKLDRPSDNNKINDILQQYIVPDMNNNKIANRDTIYQIYVDNILANNWSHDYYLHCYIALRKSCGYTIIPVDSYLKDCIRADAPTPKAIKELTDKIVTSKNLDIGCANNLDIESATLIDNKKDSVTADEKRELNKCKLAAYYKIDPLYIGPKFIKVYDNSKAKDIYNNINSINFTQDIINQVLNRSDSTLRNFNDNTKLLEQLRINSAAGRKYIATKLLCYIIGNNTFNGNVDITRESFENKIFDKSGFFMSLAEDSKLVTQIFNIYRIRAFYPRDSFKKLSSIINCILACINIKIVSTDSHQTNYNVKFGTLFDCIDGVSSITDNVLALYRIDKILNIVDVINRQYMYVYSMNQIVDIKDNIVKFNNDDLNNFEMLYRYHKQDTNKVKLMLNVIDKQHKKNEAINTIDGLWELSIDDLTAALTE